MNFQVKSDSIIMNTFSFLKSVQNDSPLWCEHNINQFSVIHPFFDPSHLHNLCRPIPNVCQVLMVINIDTNPVSDRKTVVADFENAYPFSL